MKLKQFITNLTYTQFLLIFSVGLNIVFCSCISTITTTDNYKDCVICREYIKELEEALLADGIELADVCGGDGADAYYKLEWERSRDNPAITLNNPQRNNI